MVETFALPTVGAIIVKKVQELQVCRNGQNHFNTNISRTVVQ